MRWRCRAARVRTALLVLPLVAASRCAPCTAAWRRTQPVVVPPVPIRAMLQIGKYLVGEEGDPQLTGHPNIKY